MSDNLSFGTKTKIKVDLELVNDYGTGARNGEKMKLEMFIFGPITMEAVAEEIMAVYELNLCDMWKIVNITKI